MISKEYEVIFKHDSKGFGAISLMRHNVFLDVEYPARSGSISKEGKLKNCIEDGEWYATSAPEVPVASEYDKMHCESYPGFGWKWRLHRSEDGTDKSSYLIHPDGNLPGSRGCIVTQNTNAMGLYYFSKWIYSIKPETVVPVYVVKGKA